MRWFDIRFWKWAIVVLVVGFFLLAFAGCKSKEYVKVPEYHTEYICKTDTFARVDSVLLHDSVFVYRNGDTMLVNKVTFRDRYHNIYKVTTDTIYKNDSVSVPYPIERELTKNEKRLISLGKMFVAFLFSVSVVLIISLFWYRNKEC